MLAVLLITSPQAQAQVSGTSYTVSPVGLRVYPSGEAGLSPGYLYGGEIGFGFGENFELSGLYELSSGFTTDFSDFEIEDDAAAQDALRDLASRDVDLRRYGGRLRLNVGSGSLIPFVSAGAGIIEIEPEGLEQNELIYVSGGLGLTFSVAKRYTVSVGGEGIGYRYNPAVLLSSQELAQVGLSSGDFETRTVFNPALRAALRLYLGGREPGSLSEVDLALRNQFGAGGQGLRLIVQPFYGQIQFNDALDFPEKQPLAGINAGFNLGPYVGVRGFYWRATDEEEFLDTDLPGGFEELSLYGGELNLRFGSVFIQSLNPYLILGGGYLNVGDGYVDPGEFMPDSRYFATGGAGVDIPLTANLLLNAGVRSLFLSTRDVENLADPSQVYGNLMYTVGLQFGFGGGGQSPGELLTEERIISDQLEDQRLSDDLEREVDDLEREIQNLTDDLIRAEAGDDEAIARLRERREEVEIDRSSNVSDREITIPIPEDGEIYLRFGDGTEGTTTETVYVPPTVVQTIPNEGISGEPGQIAGLTADQIREIVRQTIREELEDMDTQSLDAAQINRLSDQLDDIEDRLNDRIDAIQADVARQPAAPPVTVVERNERGETTVRTVAPRRASFLGRPLVSRLPYVGVRAGVGPEQFLAGLRWDFSAGFRPNFRLMPEVALGFGNGVSLTALGNVVVPVFGQRFFPLAPYVGAGAGITTRRGLAGLELALNLLFGAEYPLGGNSVFGEYSTLGFFDYNRLLFGYRMRF